MSRIALASTRISFKRQLLCSVFALGMIVPSGVAAASPYTETLRTALQNDPTHFNERMWEVIRANPADRDQIFSEAVRMSMKHEIALHPTKKAEIVARFKKLYPQLAEELQAEAAGQKVAMNSVESFQQPMKLRTLAQDPAYVTPGHTTWFGRNWPWVLLGGAAAVGGGVAIAVLASDDDGEAAASTPATPPGPLDPPPTVGETQEYANQGGLARANVGPANAAGFTGQGITVAVVDSGLNTLHPDIRDNIAPGGYDFIRGTSSVIDNDLGSYHGTHVSGTIAAGKNDFGMRGVAYNAKILPLAAIGGGPADAIERAYNRATDQGARVANGSFGPNDIANDLFVQNGAQFFWTQALANADAMLNFANNNGILVFAAGNSYTLSTALINNNPTGYGFLPFIRPSNANIALGQPGAYRRSEDGETLTILNADYSSLEGKLIVVVALDENNEVASFSNRCGVARDWCISAPGVNINSTINGNAYGELSGTSMAAPHVSGALAVLLEQHPELTTTQIVNLLLDTATDLGATGIDDIYGHGLLNLNAAVQATGPFSIVTGLNMNSGSTLLSGSSVTVSQAFGDSFANKLAATKVGVLDGYTRNFKVSLGERVFSRLSTFDATASLQRFGRDFTQRYQLDARNTVSFTTRSRSGVERVAAEDRVKNESAKTFDSFSFTHKTGDGLAVNVSHRDVRANALSFREDDRTTLAAQVSANGVGNPYLDFVADGYANNVSVDMPWQGRFRATTAMGSPDTDSGQNNMLAMAELGYGDSDTGLTFASGALVEKDRVLGLRGEGAFALGSGTTTWFGGVTGQWQVAPKTQLVASFHAGMSDAQTTSNSLVQDIGRVTTTSWRVGLTQGEVLREGDKARLIVSQPLRAETGGLNLNLPQYRLRDGTMIRQNVNYTLTPSGREVDVEAGYSFSLADKSKLDFAAMYRHDAGHVAGKSEVIGLTRFSRGF